MVKQKTKRIWLFAAVALALALVFTGTAISLTRSQSAYAAADEPMYSQDFSQVANGELPTGWAMVSAASSGTAAVQNGKLVLTSNGDAAKNVMVRLPQRLFDNLQNFSFTVRFKMLRTTDGDEGRYLGILVRGQNLNSSAPLYYQMAIRNNPRFNNSGIELAQRKASSWNVPGRYVYNGDDLKDGKLNPETEYTAEVRVYGQKIQAYMNGVRMGSVTMDAAHSFGELGLQVCNNVTEITNVTVRVLEEPKFSGLVQEYNIAQSVGDAPATATEIVDKAAYDALKSINTRPGSAILHLQNKNNGLRVTAKDGTDIASIEAAFTKLNKRVIPVFYVSDQATADALAAFVNENEAEDLAVMASDGELIAAVREKCPEVRGMLCFTETDFGSDAERLAVRDTTNKSLAKTAVLTFEAATQETIVYLQKRMVSVWVTGAETQDQIAAAMLRGADGIVGDCMTVYDLIDKLPEGTRLRAPFVVGHRGYCPDGSTFPENSLEAAKAAYEQGADAIENDVYMTTDNHFVIAHDNEVSWFGAKNEDGSDASGLLENMTLAQVKKLYLRDGKTRIPTLNEYFEEFKGKDILHYTEIKTNKAEFAEVFADLVKEKGVSSQIDLISFSKPTTFTNLRKFLPEVSIGYLNQDRAYQPDQVDTVETILSQCVPINATYHPFYQKLTDNINRKLRNRGMQVNPWTLDTRSVVQTAIENGNSSLTTDEAGALGAFAERLQFAGDSVTLSTQTGTAVPLTITYKRGEPQTVNAQGAVVLRGKTRLTVADGKFTAVEVAGETECVVAFYYRYTCDMAEYTLLTQPVTVKIEKQAEPGPEPGPEPTPEPAPETNGGGCNSAALGGGTAAGVAAAIGAAIVLLVLRRRKRA